MDDPLSRVEDLRSAEIPYAIRLSEATGGGAILAPGGGRKGTAYSFRCPHPPPQRPAVTRNHAPASLAISVADTNGSNHP